MNNEEKIIALLEKQGETLEKQGELLAKHDVMLERINETLAAQGALLAKHDVMLEHINETLTAQGELLAKHDVMLEHINETLTEHSEMLENLTTRVTKIELTQENIIIPHIQALAEGQETLRQTLCPRDRAERLEADVDLLKSAVRGLFRDVQELKKAQ